MTGTCCSGCSCPAFTDFFGETLDGVIFDVFTIDNGVITRIDEFKTREGAITYAGSTASAAEPDPGQRAPDALALLRPRVERVVPILNVSDIHQSFAWFEKLGWRKGFEWKSDASDDRPGFGSVRICQVVSRAGDIGYGATHDLGRDELTRLAHAEQGWAIGPISFRTHCTSSFLSSSLG